MYHVFFFPKGWTDQENILILPSQPIINTAAF